MRILVINSGSSTLKFDLIDVDMGADTATGTRATRRLAHGVVDRIGRESNLDFHTASGESDRREVHVKDHQEAVSQVFAWLGTILNRECGMRNAEDGAESQSFRIPHSPFPIDAVGHRVVHGGERLVTPVLIDDSVVAALEELSELAPLHNPAAIQGIRAVREALGPDVPMVAVFDTAFHSTLPLHASTYALPYELAERHHIRRYGFHGIAHEYMLRRYSELANTSVEKANIITLQLGNGCSAAAIRKGRSVDTSMGFTPLEGLVMGTRSGDLDPSVVAYLVRKEQVDAEEVETWLNERSGLSGVSGTSSDMRDLLAAMEHDEQARLAVDLFCYRVRKYIGAYLAVLGGADAVVFGGGIGEHSPYIRARICEGMEWCGLQLDPTRNASATGAEGRISADNAKVHAYAISVDESMLIAQYTAQRIMERDLQRPEG